MAAPYLCRGALHIHSVFSHDATGTVPDIAAAAQQAGLRWIIMTDHNTIEGFPLEGWHSEVLVLMGLEITPRHNHLLALNIDHLIRHEQPVQQFVDEVYACGGFGIIAHPDDRALTPLKKATYTWDDWSLTRPGMPCERPMGLELWNLMSDWGSQLTPRNKYLNFYHLRRGLRGPTPTTLAWWDQLMVAGQRTFGVAGVDAHALKKRTPWGGTVEVLGYRRSFRSLTNYLLLDAPLPQDVAAARRAVYTALLDGRLFFVNRLDGDIAQVPLLAQRGSEVWHIGARVPYDAAARNETLLLADVGRRARLRLLHNGRVVAVARGERTLRHRVAAPGIYRLEAWRNGRPWLFTNAISVEFA